jgi:triosephosphate isomerase
LALEAGIIPLLFVGQGREEGGSVEDALASRMSRILDGFTAVQVSRMAFVFEPEGSIGRDAPITPQFAAQGCRLIRSWLREAYGNRIAESIRIIYGGSVAPEFARDLLASPDLDGLGASRKGRDPVSFAEIVHLVNQVKHP